MAKKKAPSQATKVISFDFAIKYLLRDKANYDIVEGFISAILKEQGYPSVKIVSLLDPESNREEYSQKRSIADLVVEDEQKRKYIVEVERQEVSNFVHKSCFNTARLVADQISSGTDFLSIKKVIHISLLYFKIGKAPVYHGKTIVREVEKGEKLDLKIYGANNEVYELTDIFPEYIFISIPQFNDRLERELDEWLYILKHEEVKSEFHSPYMRKVAEKLSILHMTTAQRDEYFNYMKALDTYRDAISTAEHKGLEKGKLEGLKEGKAEGLKEGEEKGKLEGKLEGKVEIAKNLLKKGMNTADIQEITGLSLDQIKGLENQ